MKLLCILLSDSNTAWAGNLICRCEWRSVGTFHTAATAWRSCYLPLTASRQSRMHKITMPEVKRNGWDLLEWVTAPWLPWPVLSALVMIWRCSQEQLAKTIIASELIAMCLYTQLSNSEGSSSPLPSLKSRQEPGLWQPGLAGANRGNLCPQKKDDYIPSNWPVPWIFMIWTLLNFSSTPLCLAWQQDTSLTAWGLGYRGYRTMQVCKDDQVVLFFSLTSFRRI